MTSYPTRAENMKEQYLNNLKIEIANNARVYYAVKLKDVKPILPIRPPEFKSIEEKENDIQGMLNQLRENLTGLTDGVSSTLITNDLRQNIELLRFVLQTFPAIKEYISKTYSLGINYTAFITYVEQQFNKNNALIVAVQPLIQIQNAQQALLDEQARLAQEALNLRLRQQQYLYAQEQLRLQLIQDEKQRLHDEEKQRKQDALAEELRLIAEEQRKISEARDLAYQDSLQFPSFQELDVEPTKPTRSVKNISFVPKKSIKTLRKEEEIQQKLEYDQQMDEMAERVMLEIENELRRDIDGYIHDEKLTEIKRLQKINEAETLAEERRQEMLKLEAQRKIDEEQALLLERQRQDKEAGDAYDERVRELQLLEQKQITLSAEALKQQRENDISNAKALAHLKFNFPLIKRKPKGLFSSWSTPTTEEKVLEDKIVRGEMVEQQVHMLQTDNVEFYDIYLQELQDLHKAKSEEDQKQKQQDEDAETARKQAEETARLIKEQEDEAIRKTNEEHTKKINERFNEKIKKDKEDADKENRGLAMEQKLQEIAGKVNTEHTSEQNQVRLQNIKHLKEYQDQKIKDLRSRG